MKISSAQYEGSAIDRKGMPTCGLPEVGFAGRSNVGKSSLINCLAGVKGLARTSSTPGRTRCLNFFLINSSFFFVDLPGYGYAKIPKEMRSSFQGMVESYLRSRPHLKGLILILDGRHDPMASDLMLRDWLIREGLPFRIVLTKMDKLPRRKWPEVQRRAGSVLGCAEESIVLFSSVTEEGKKEVWQAIEEMLRDDGEKRKGSGPSRIHERAPSIQRK
jgi:GTP-binding protein